MPMIPPHKNSAGQDCLGCGCEQSEWPHNNSGIALLGCCAMRLNHGAFRFDEDTGEVTQWPLCCADHVHTGPDEPDECCPAHRPTKPEHTVTLTATGPLLPLDEPEVTLRVVKLQLGRPGDQVVAAFTDDERKVMLPANAFPVWPKSDPKQPLPMLPAGDFDQSTGIVTVSDPHPVTLRGYIVTRRGALYPTVSRQFAERRLAALFGRIQRARFEHTFTWKERGIIEKAQDPEQAANKMIRDKGRVMYVNLKPDIDAGRIDITVTAMALVVNPHNPEDGGREFHHVPPLDGEVAVVTPMIESSPTLALAAN